MRAITWALCGCGSFALNRWLQYRARGRWVSLFRENIYIPLSLVARSLLARQVFGGTLAG